MLIDRSVVETSVLIFKDNIRNAELLTVCSVNLRFTVLISVVTAVIGIIYEV